ncbi:hypothetical protein VLK81_05930 [Citroniella saccharovorans]|uniref:Uncharacterized protein n=1 Tax=Citroniella saccharovorans TaxID=2053367 RepID=A0AAW9MZR8_9FIRM|nr:hypothetical protein [Citroniella saccharovorans]MEB3429552.1 hypothetical protein [Citroniella saccharovorans]
MTLKKLQIDDYKLAVKAITNFFIAFSNLYLEKIKSDYEVSKLNSILDSYTNYMTNNKIIDSKFIFTKINLEYDELIKSFENLEIKTDLLESKIFKNNFVSKSDLKEIIDVISKISPDLNNKFENLTNYDYNKEVDFILEDVYFLANQKSINNLKYFLPEKILDYINPSNGDLIIQERKELENLIKSNDLLKENLENMIMIIQGIDNDDFLN